MEIKLEYIIKNLDMLARSLLNEKIMVLAGTREIHLSPLMNRNEFLTKEWLEKLGDKVQAFVGGLEREGWMRGDYSEYKAGDILSIYALLRHYAEKRIEENLK